MKLCRPHLKPRFGRMSGMTFTLFALTTPIVSQAQRPSEAQVLADMVPMASISQSLGNIREFCLSSTGACMYVLLGATLIALGAVFFAEFMSPAEEESEAHKKEQAASSQASNFSLATTAGIALLLILVAGMFLVG